MVAAVAVARVAEAVVLAVVRQVLLLGATASLVEALGRVAPDKMSMHDTRTNWHSCCEIICTPVVAGLLR
eukprot:2651124-Prymnesium_polylepis.1